VEQLASAGVPVTVMASPMIPGLNDHELPNILLSAAQAGARAAGYIPLRLPGNVAPVFLDWLQRHFPERRRKVENNIRELRGGELNQSDFHLRFRGQGAVAEHLAQLYQIGLKRSGLQQQLPPLRHDLFRRPGPQQLELF
jgi:DNA repair photolyase